MYRLGKNFKNYNKSVQPLYDIEDIYEWIDYMRETGQEQSLKWKFSSTVVLNDLAEKVIKLEMLTGVETSCRFRWACSVPFFVGKLVCILRNSGLYLAIIWGIMGMLGGVNDRSEEL